MRHALIIAAVAAGSLLLLSLVLTAYWMRTSRKHSTPDFGLHIVTRGMR